MRPHKVRNKSVLCGAATSNVLYLQKVKIFELDLGEFESTQRFLVGYQYDSCHTSDRFCQFEVTQHDYTQLVIGHSMINQYGCN